MAVDEALLDLHAPDSGPVLRTYRWDRPTLSLGRSQHCPERWEPGRLHAHGVFLVRRPTGGLAVLHDREWTYAVVGGKNDPSFPPGVVPTYEAIARALLIALDRLGIEGAVQPPDEPVSPVQVQQPSCFRANNHHEISVGGRGKLIGSAQRRRDGAFLQHGSILFDTNRARWAEIFGESDSGGWTSIRELLGTLPAEEIFEQAMRTGFATAFSADLIPAELSEAEGRRAAELYSWKYASLDWTRQGIQGARERRWGPPWEP